MLWPFGAHILDERHPVVNGKKNDVAAIEKLEIDQKVTLKRQPPMSGSPQNVAKLQPERETLMFLLPHILERARANLIVAVYSATHRHPAIMQLRGNHIERPECKSLKEVVLEQLIHSLKHSFFVASASIANRFKGKTSARFTCRRAGGVDTTHTIISRSG